MIRFCTIFLLITILFPPVTVASISMACAMPDMEAMPMSHPMDHASDEPMDPSHACCTMPDPGDECDVTFVTDAYTCCDEVHTSRDHNLIRILPVSRYDASDISLTAFTVATDMFDVAMPAPRLASVHTTSFLEDPSPPLQSLLCTYII